MADFRLYNGSDTDLLVPNEAIHSSSEVLWITSSSRSVHGTKPRVKFENISWIETGGTFFQPIDDQEENNDEEDYDACFRQPTEEKRRLSVEQVQLLEKSFQVGSKLELERKVQLAKELGLLPRQVAIWFQNRRARFKTKQLEKDYGSLQASYDQLKVDHDNLVKQKENLITQVNALRNKLLEREKGKENLEQIPAMTSAISDLLNAISNNSDNLENQSKTSMMVFCKQEDASSAKSDVLDSESPNMDQQNHSTMVEPADSSHVLEPDQSDFSQEEEDNFSRTLMPSCFPKLEEESYYDDPSSSSCNFGFPVEDQAFCFWSC